MGSDNTSGNPIANDRPHAFAGCLRLSPNYPGLQCLRSACAPPVFSAFDSMLPAINLNKYGSTLQPERLSSTDAAQL